MTAITCADCFTAENSKRNAAQADIEPLSALTNAASQLKLQKKRRKSKPAFSVETKIILAGIVVGVIIVGSLVYTLFIRTWWEDHNRDNLLIYKRNAETLAREGQPTGAKAQYDQMFALLADRQIENEDLRQSIKEAHTEADKIASTLAAEEQARQDTKHQQLEATARASQEQEKVRQDAANATAMAEQQIQNERKARRHEIAETWLRYGKAKSEADDLERLYNSQKELVDTMAGHSSPDELQKAVSDATQTSGEFSSATRHVIEYLTTIKSYDSHESGSVANELLNDPTTPRKYLPYIRDLLE